MAISDPIFTREMYKPSLHLVQLIINWKYGVHKEDGKVMEQKEVMQWEKKL